jgi:MoaA/NifB/PqqE/SkfB family radical SAM enzyme
MLGQQLSWPIVRNLINDAKKLGVESIRFYGGEPLLHKELSLFVRHAVRLGLRSYVTTNGILLKDRICELYEAGLRDFTIGFYGTGAAYDDYVQRKTSFARLEQSIATVRQLYGMGVNLRLNWLLMRPTCSIECLHKAWSFADQYSMPIQVDLIHYSLPYFTEGPNRELQFRPEDRQTIEKVVAEIIRLKNERPQMIQHSLAGLRSIPDWLIKGPAMKVPCDKYEMIWVGADGTVQLRYVTFKLGNLHSQRLAQMVSGSVHRRAARDCYSLTCPNCHCAYDLRIQKHAASRWQYGLKHFLTGGNSEEQDEQSHACVSGSLCLAEDILVANSNLVAAAKK